MASVLVSPLSSQWGQVSRSATTASWSESPGIDAEYRLSDGFVEKARSMVFPFLVGSSWIWVSLPVKL